MLRSLYKIPAAVAREVGLLLGLEEWDAKVDLYCTLADAAIFTIGCFHYVCDDNISSRAYLIEMEDFRQKTESVLPCSDMMEYGQILSEKIKQGITVRTPIFFGPFSRVIDFWPEGRRYHERLVEKYAGYPLLIITPKDLGDLKDTPAPANDVKMSKDHIYKRMLGRADAYSRLEYDVRQL